MIKIVYLTTGLNMGGAEVMLYNLLSNINRDRFEPIVISLMDKGVFGEQIEHLNIPVYTADMLIGKPTVASIRRLIELVKQIQPDLIQGWMYHGNLAAQFSNFLTGKKIPVLWSIHHSLHDLASEKPLTQGIIRFGSWSSKYVNKIKIAYVSERSQTQQNLIALAQAWKEMITMDKSTRANLGQAARQRIIDKFSLNMVFEQYEQLY